MLRSFGELARHIAAQSPSAGATVIVGIDGGGGAGKSTFAKRLAAHLPHAAVVHTDEFASWDEPINWWPRLLRYVLEPLANGQSGRYQRYDWGERRLAEWHSVIAPIVILEGVTALRREFAPYLAYRIWIDCGAEMRLRRGLARAGSEAAENWREWMRAEDEYAAVHRPRETADLVVCGDPPAPLGDEEFRYL